MGIITRCVDPDGPPIEWGESETSTNDGDGGGTGFDGGFVDINTCKVDELLDSIADFLKDIFGGGDDGGGGGETPPEGGENPPEGGDTPPEGGETPPEGGETPPPDEGGGDGEQSGMVIDVSGTTIGWVKLSRPLGSSVTRLVIPAGTYRRVGGKIRLPVRSVRRAGRIAARR
jgi:hypothetical protein